MKSLAPDYFCHSFMESERAARREYARRLVSVLVAALGLFALGFAVSWFLLV